VKDPKIDATIESLGLAFRANPFDFFKENDVTCFLYGELLRQYPERVALSLDPDIERFGGFPASLTTVRVHTEIKDEARKESLDLVVLEDGQARMYAKSQKMMGGFRGPFHAAIEVKMAYGSRSNRFSSQGIPNDIERLGGKVPKIVKHAYAVAVDFFEGRDISHISELARSRNVRLGYVDLERTQFLGA